MEDSLRTKILLTAGLILVGLGLIIILQAQSLGKLRIIFCDVGQGDGMLIISPGGHEAVVDAGAGSRMVNCLSSYMPFWDRKIELIVPTHAHEEHMQGFMEVLARYKVKSIMTTNVPNIDAQFYKEWQKSVGAEQANVYEPNVGDTILLDPQKGNDSAKLDVLWPPFVKTSEGKPSIEEWKNNPPSDLNDTSIVMRLSYGDFCAYLTGDLPKEILEELISGKCQVLKVVHHGSRTGTSQKVLDEIDPKVAVIQVGKSNKFGHPHKEVIDLLESKGIKILRNDINGIVEIDSDGKSFNIKN